jgi:hypothetical protein
MSAENPEPVSKAARHLRNPLPKNIRQEGGRFIHPTHGLLQDLTKSARLPGATGPMTDREKMEARKVFLSWWHHTEEQIQRLKDGPEGARRLYRHYLDPDNPLPDPKDEWPPGWVD